MRRLRLVVLWSWVAVLVMRGIAPAGLMTWALTVAVGSSCYWLARRMTDDEVLWRLIWWSWFAKMVLAVSLFFISYWSLPVFRGLQLGSGFWVITRDPSFFDWLARWILDCWRLGHALPGRLFYDQAQQLYCAGLYRFFGSSPLPVIALGVGYSTLTVLVAYDLIRRFDGDRTACRMGAGLIACWPSAAVWSTQMIKEPLVLFGILLIFWCITVLFDRKESAVRHQWSWIGLSAAVLAVTLFRFYVGGVLVLSAIPAFIIAAIVQPRPRVVSLPWMLVVGLVLGGSVFASLTVFYLKPEAGHPAWYQFQAPTVPIARPAEQPGTLRPSSSDPLGASPARPPETSTPDLPPVGPGAIDVLAFDPSEPRRLPPTPKSLPRKSLAPLKTMIAIRNGYIRTGGASNSASPTEQIYRQRTAVTLLPHSMAAAFLEPYPADWFAVGEDVKAFRRFAMVDMALIYLLIPGFLLAILDRAVAAHPARFYLMIFSVTLAVIIGFSIVNIGTLFRLRLQFLLPFIVLWASSPRATRWYAAGGAFLLRSAARAAGAVGRWARLRRAY